MLVKDDLRDVVVVLHLARAVFSRIQLNFVWALGFNCLGIPIACGVLYPAFEVRLPPVSATLPLRGLRGELFTDSVTCHLL